MPTITIENRIGRMYSLTAILLLAVLTGGCHIAASGHNHQGKRLFQQGQYHEALSSFQEALKDDPENSDAYYNIAAVYHNLATQSGDKSYHSQAEESYRRAIELNPDHVEGYRGLAVLMVESGRKTEAFQLLDGWAIRNPESPEPRIELARLYKEFGDREQARGHLTTALTIDPDNARTLRSLALLQEEQGNLSAALGMYEKSYARNNMQPGLTAHIASLQQSVGIRSSAGPATNTRTAGIGSQTLRR